MWSKLCPYATPPQPDRREERIWIAIEHIQAEKKMTATLQTFSNAFAWMKIYDFQLNFTEVCS